MSLVDRREIHYPASDGAPLGETPSHIAALIAIRHALRCLLRPRADAYVGNNMFVYYVEGDAKQVVCPDGFVVFGARPGSRDVWKTWVEGAFPQVVFELVSASSRAQDVGAKRAVYEELGTEEYFVFDPLREIEPPPLRGWRRMNGRFVRIEPESVVGPVTLRSDQLGVLLREEGDMLRFVDSLSGEALRFPEEDHDLRLAAAEAAQLRVEVERLRRK